MLKYLDHVELTHWISAYVCVHLHVSFLWRTYIIYWNFVVVQKNRKIGSITTNRCWKQNYMVSKVNHHRSVWYISPQFHCATECTYVLYESIAISLVIILNFFKICIYALTCFMLNYWAIIKFLCQIFISIWLSVKDVHYICFVQ